MCETTAFFVSVCERLNQLSVFRGTENHRKLVVFSSTSIQLVAIAWRTREMMKWDGR